MAIVKGTPITELNVVVRIEVARRLDHLAAWALESGTVYVLAHPEGEPESVWGKVPDEDVLKYEEVGSIILCEAQESSWFYDSATGNLYLHATNDADPETADMVLLSLFWRPFGNIIMDVDGKSSEPLLDKASIPGISTGITLSSQGGARTTFGAIKLMNDGFFFYTDLSAYEYQAKRLECWVGNVGDAFASFVQYFTGWTGDIDIDDSAMTIGVEDLRLYVP